MQSTHSLCAAVRQCEALATPSNPQACRQHAERYASQPCRQTLRSFVEARWAALHLSTDLELDTVTPFPSKGRQPSSLNSA